MTACSVQVVGLRPRRSPVLPADTSTSRPGWSVQAKPTPTSAFGLDHGRSGKRRSWFGWRTCGESRGYGYDNLTWPQADGLGSSGGSTCVVAGVLS